MTRADAVVVGAGHNGLAAAIVLAAAGWEVVVLERNGHAGGAVRTAEVTLPGFRHDLYAANLNLFVGSPFFGEYGERLFEHGFGIAGSTHPFASLFPDGTMLGVSTDEEETARSLRSVSSADADSWRELARWFEAVAPVLFGVLGAPMPSLGGARALWENRQVLRAQGPELARLALQSPRELVEDHFEDPKVQALCASWGMHLDFAPSVSGGAVFAMLETFASAAHGMALGRGGAGGAITAMEGLLSALGGRVVVNSEVERIETRGGRAIAVTVRDGDRYEATRGVIANLTPGPLFSKLVERDDLPTSFKRRIARYRYGPGTMMIHLAMSDMPRWRAGSEVDTHAYVHVAPYLFDLSLAYEQAVAGLLPERPMIVVGQPTTIDPTRAPEGKHVLWIQVRAVPAKIRGDARGEIEGRSWEEVKDAYADRVLDLLEEYAPGLRALILGRYVISPADLERENPNLVGGDHLGGSHHLAQHFVFRPAPGFSRYGTPIERLYMCGSGTWPGGGVGAGSGYLLGRMLTRPTTVSRVLSAPAAVARRSAQLARESRAAR